MAASQRAGAIRQDGADVGVTGLAVMGRNLARNFARHGYAVAVHNRSSQRTRDLVAEHGGEGTFVPTESMTEFVASLARPRVIVVMVKAGQATDAVIGELVPLLDEGDILMDCGNAHYADTRRREAALRAHGVHFVGCGVSGGEEGALNGPSIMPGGPRQAYARLGPILEGIAAQVDGTPCCTYVGPDGAGHFVKMVHNGVEYALMAAMAGHLASRRPQQALALWRKHAERIPRTASPAFRLLRCHAEPGDSAACSRAFRDYAER